ncbi:MAG: DNA-binding domain-containing protein [Pseudomonadota bacterium]
MSHLRDLQLAFGEYLFAPENGAPITNAIVSDENGDADSRMALYGDSYVLRLIESLSVDFPGVHALLGDHAFDVMCREYIAVHPSEHPSIRWFGRHLVEFLNNTSPYSEQEILIEMVAFEWAKNQVFDAPDSNVVAIDELAAVNPEDWGDMHFEFVPAMRKILLHNNVTLLWNAVNGEEESLPDLERSEHSVQWLVWRKSMDPNWRSLEVDESFALQYCQDGMRFGELCERLCEWVDEEHAPMRAVTFLKTWIDSEIVSRIEVNAA